MGRVQECPFLPGKGYPEGHFPLPVCLARERREDLSTRVKINEWVGVWRAPAPGKG